MKHAPLKPVTLALEQVEAIRQAVFQLVEKHLDVSFYLVDVALEKEMGAWYLRLYIEKPDYSVSLSDCEQVSRALDEQIDNLKALQDFPYSLEVSSPGLFRSLTREREFTFYIGRPVRVIREELQAPVSKNRRLKPSVIEHELATGSLKAYNAASRSVTLMKADQTDITLVLEADSRVFLNPKVQIPDVEVETSDAAIDLNPNDLLEDSNND